MKTILFLGAAQFQIPPIRYARERGYRVITCDNRPENPGHRLAHKSYPVSTIDASELLDVARRERVDGILTFGSDVSAPSASRVAEELNLPGNSPDSIRILTRKSDFRAFMNETGIQPQAFSSFSESELARAKAYLERAESAMVVKPIDVSGSKGVTVVTERAMINRALQEAFAESICKRIIIESFVAKRGRQICGDGFFQDGEIVFLALGDGHFYEDPRFMAPYGETFPSDHDPEDLAKVKTKLNQVLRASGFRQGPFNLDVIMGTDGQPFVLEIGPRCGGNYLPTAIQLQTGFDLVAASVVSCLDPDFRVPIQDFLPRPDVFHACLMVHARTGGVLRQVRYSDVLRKHIVAEHPYLVPGDMVTPFTKANAAIGNLILRFEARAQMEAVYEQIHDHYQVCFEPGA